MPDTKLKFTAHTFRCTNSCGLPVEYPPKLVTRRRFYFGQPGMTEIVGGTAGRKITFDVWIRDNFASFAKHHAYMIELDGLVGRHGTLVFEFQGDTTKWKHTTFDGCERLPIEATDSATALKDIIGAPVGPDGWFSKARLHFFQLQTEL